MSLDVRTMRYRGTKCEGQHDAICNWIGKGSIIAREISHAMSDYMAKAGDQE